jgi:succinate dehydrogenase cytochrome b556 subunit
MKLRPISPHLTIYSAQLTSSLSIFHRVTGSFLLIIFILISVLFFICSSFTFTSISFEFYMSTIAFIKSLAQIPYIFNLFVSFIVFINIYHGLNGIRHICWDLGYFLNINDVYTTGYVVITCSLILSILTICCIF